MNRYFSLGFFMLFAAPQWALGAGSIPKVTYYFSYFPKVCTVKFETKELLNPQSRQGTITVDEDDSCEQQINKMVVDDMQATVHIERGNPHGWRITQSRDDGYTLMLYKIPLEENPTLKECADQQRREIGRMMELPLIKGLDAGRRIDIERATFHIDVFQSVQRLGIETMVIPPFGFGETVVNIQTRYQNGRCRVVRAEKVATEILGYFAKGF